MRVYLSRFVCGGLEENFQRLEEEAQRAASAELAVFPELFLTGYRLELAPARAREHFARLSRTYPKTLFAFGTISEEGKNRLTLWLAGEQVAFYDKVHLFRPNQEHRLWQEGDTYVAVETPFGRLGLLTCNDIRFPEQARQLVLQGGAHILLAVAWWPWRRDHIWRTLLQARAIENASWVLGCCIAACTNPQEPFAGAGNYAFDPLGQQLLPVDDLTYQLDLQNPPPVLVDPRETFRPVENLRLFSALP
jgi:predicted amidohydrolase